MLAVELLFAGFGSVWLPETVAVLVILVALAGAFTTMVIVAVAPEASEPMLQVTVPEALVQVPWVELAETNVTPEGRVSVTVVPVAPFGPLLVAFRVYVIGAVTVAVVGPVLVIATSACSAAVCTVVDADAELLAGFGSDSLPLTVAVLVMVPTEVGLTVIVNVTLAPEASELALQVTVTEALVQPELADMKVTPAGRLSVTTTPVAGLGPLFVAISE